MLTGNQIRAARVLAGLGRGQVALQAGLSRDAIIDIESAGPSVLRSDDAAARKVREALESAGVEFLEDGAPGVRLRPARREQGMRTEALNAENDD